MAKIIRKLVKLAVIAYITDLCRRKIYGEIEKAAKKPIKKTTKKTTKRKKK